MTTCDMAPQQEAPMQQQTQKIERALISVSNKDGIVPFAQGLAEQGVDILSTGGTAKRLRDAGVPVRDISEFTGFPEMLDGRVKTLHPNVHAGLLHMRGNVEHEKTMQEHGLMPIDLVCVNLYPFEQTVAKPNVSFEEAIENIDIGGPTMVRSAAKNMRDVTVVTDPSDYEDVIDCMQQNEGNTTPELRRKLAQKAFARVAAYNAAIAQYLAGQLDEVDAPRPYVLTCPSGTTLRYGENPHQQALFYREPQFPEPCIAHAEVLHGKEMSYNNYVDGDAALEAVKELSGIPAVAIIKHTNPCGYATGSTLAEAFEAAWAGDPVSAFGSVIAVTQPVDLATAECLNKRFVEVLIAPDFEPEAFALLTKKKNLRLLKLHRPMAQAGSGKTVRQINGGLLIQDRDSDLTSEFRVETEARFPDAMQALATFGMRACKHIKSNAIIIAREYQPGQFMLLGMGAGQPNRVDSVGKLAVPRAKENIRLLYEKISDGTTVLADFEKQVLAESVLVSDAFFPFPDNIEQAAGAGIRFILQPGGSMRDGEVIAACNEHGVAMAFTGMRHFKH